MSASPETIEKLKTLWNVWNLRGFILFSFSLQCILIFGSSLRIQTSRSWVHRQIWFVYLLADWAAYYAIGLVVPVDRLQSQNVYTSDIHAFWAPFLLLHLGGPNTIAGFSLEDNELWDRSVLHIIVQAGATGIAIYRALSKKQLLAPTLLVFIAAFSRYVGRILALSKGSLDDLRESISEERAGDTGSMTISTDERASSVVSPSEQAEAVEMVEGAYKSFQKYKGLFCGLSIKTDAKMRQRLYSLKPYQALIEMEIQAGLAYELFYTKIWTIIENKTGKILHIISLSSEVGALVLWAFAKKHGYEKVDIQLTNTLIIGGIVVDLASTLKLPFSDLGIYHLSKCCPNSRIVGCVLNKLLSAKEPNRGKCWVLFRRWSGSIKQFNLMSYEESCSPRKVKLLRQITGYETGVSRVELTDAVKNHIITSIKLRASKNGILDTRVPRELGGYILEMYDERILLANAMKQICRSLGVVDALLVCHIATHQLYPKGGVGNEENIFRDVNIQMSEYLMYLLFYQPKMILEGAELDMTVEDMMKHLEKIKKEIANDQSFTGIRSERSGELDLSAEQEIEEDELKRQEATLTRIFKEVEGGKEIKVDLVSRLATYIVSLLKDRRISEELMSDIWIDFLLYSAIHCRGRMHVQQLGNGGQLLTIVWLMMTHLGLKIRFRSEAGLNHK